MFMYPSWLVAIDSMICTISCSATTCDSRRGREATGGRRTLLLLLKLMCLLRISMGDGVAKLVCCADRGAGRGTRREPLWRRGEGGDLRWREWRRGRGGTVVIGGRLGERDWRNSFWFAVICEMMLSIFAVTKSHT